jgi:lipid II:glycine glycyltransferase (peptidoglycan interpeptide bridge formation enzyme)
MSYFFKEIENEFDWNAFIEKYDGNASFIQSWEWSEFELSQGKKLKRIGIYDEKSSHLKGVMLITKVVAKRGVYLHVRNGPLLDWGDKELINDTVEYLKKQAKEEGCDFFRISPLIENTVENKKTLKDLGFVDCQMHDVDAEITWVLDLDQTEEEILKGMRKNTRYYVGRAAKDGVKIIKSVNPDDLKLFWPIFEDTVKRQQWNAYPYEYVLNEFKTFSKNGKALLMLAEYQGKYIAGSLFVYFNETGYYHHSGSLTEFNKIPASYLIQWEAIKEAKNRGMKKYNFFGIARTDNKNHPWAGLTFFKKGFGGHEEISIHAQDYPLKKRYWITNIYELIERKRKGY